MLARSSALVLVLAVAPIAACHDGGTDAAVADMATLPDLAPAPPDMTLPRRDPTDHPASLQLTNYGGGTIAAMEVYTVVWHGQDALGAKVDKFMSSLVTSDYWLNVTSEYGGMKGTSKGVVVLDADPPATLDDAQMDDLVGGLVTAGHIPDVNANTVVFFVVPLSTKSTLYGSQGCYEYGGYHAETQTLIGGRHVPYAVNLQCAGAALSSSTGFDSLTVTMSHEAVEAQTDPHPFSAPGWLAGQVQLGEVCDLCVYSDTTLTVPGDAGLPDTTYAVTSVYSNAAAIAGTKEPCQPTPANQPYFNVAVSPSEIVINTDASGVGVADAAYEPFAFGDVGTIKWTIMQPPGQGIKITPTSGQAEAGDTVRMKVSTTSAARSGSYTLILSVRSAKAGKTYYTSTITVN